MRYLITKSLLESWSYLFDCYEGCEDDAMASFMSALRRERCETTEAMQNGIDFENAVYAMASGHPVPSNPEWESGIRKVAEVIRNAPVQLRFSRELTVNDMTFLVYGILDALKAGVIYDVKFSNRKFSNSESDPGVYGKYLTCSQHPAYFYLVPEATRFQYLLSDGEDLYIEEYTREMTQPIGEIIAGFISWLESENLLEVYKEHWKAKS